MFDNTPVVPYGMEYVEDINSTQKEDLAKITDALLDLFPSDTIDEALDANPNLTEVQVLAIKTYLKNKVNGDMGYITGSRHVLQLVAEWPVNDMDYTDVRAITYTALTGKELTN